MNARLRLWHTHHKVVLALVLALLGNSPTTDAIPSIVEWPAVGLFG